MIWIIAVNWTFQFVLISVKYVLVTRINMFILQGNVTLHWSYILFISTSWFISQSQPFSQIRTWVQNLRESPQLLRLTKKTPASTKYTGYIHMHTYQSSIMSWVQRAGSPARSELTESREPSSIWTYDNSTISATCLYNHPNKPSVLPTTRLFTHRLYVLYLLSVY